MIREASSEEVFSKLRLEDSEDRSIRVSGEEYSK